MDYESFKTSMGLTEDINENTPWSETVEIMNALMEQQQAEAEAAATESDAEAQTEAEAGNEAAGE